MVVFISPSSTPPQRDGLSSVIIISGPQKRKKHSSIVGSPKLSLFTDPGHST